MARASSSLAPSKRWVGLLRRNAPATSAIAKGASRKAGIGDHALVVRRAEHQSEQNSPLFIGAGPLPQPKIQCVIAAIKERFRLVAPHKSLAGWAQSGR